MVDATANKSKQWKTPIILVVIAVLIIVGFNFVPRSKSEIKVMDAFRNISLLKTVELEVSRVVALKKTTIFGKQYMLLELTSFIKAGFDLTNLSEDDITVKDDEIFITLPEELSVNFNFPPDKSPVLFLDSTGLRKNFSPEKILEEQQRAEEEIRKEFEGGELLKSDAKSNLQLKIKMLENILKKKVTVRFKES
jgi:hypothetical protein